jgi:hypothetical protein
MDRFRTVLVILILLITLHLLYKLLQRKRSTVEPLVSEFTTDMNAMRALHSPEIELPSYKVLKVVTRPTDIPVSDTNTYNSNKLRLAQKKKELKETTDKLKKYTVAYLKAPAPKKTDSELKKPTDDRITTKPSGWSTKRWNDYKKPWGDYDKRKAADLAKYNREKSIYDVRVNEKGSLTTKKTKLEGDVITLTSAITAHEFKVVGKKNEIAKYNSDNDSDTYKNYLLKDLLFKASYNSASIGKKMNPDMVELVLKRGCRYLDFEVHKSDGNLYVSSDKSVRLIDVLGIINKSLMGNTDPLFINLRLASNITFVDFRGQIPANVRSMLYSQAARKIDNDTRIGEVQGKCIIITNRNMRDVTNILSDCNAICAYEYSEITQFAGNQKSKKLTIVNPDNNHVWFFSNILNWLFGWIFGLVQSNTKDADSEYLVKTYKTNIIPFRFYKNPKTAEFIFYETIFNNGGCTIIPLKSLDSESFQKITDEADKIY